MIDLGGDRTETGGGSPSVLVRTFTTPPAAPWDQARAARLEAVQTAPVRGLAVRTARLGRWRPRAPGTFAAVYVREAEIDRGLTVQRRLPGGRIKVHFSPYRPEGRNSRSLIGIALILGGCALFVVALTQSLQLRADRAATLSAGEKAAARQADRAGEAASRQRVSAALAGREDAGRPLMAALGDLATALSDRTEIPIEAVHWRSQGVAVEVRGEQSPFADKLAEKSPRALRPGVWLWAVPNKTGA